MVPVPPKLFLLNQIDLLTFFSTGVTHVLGRL